MQNVSHPQPYRSSSTASNVDPKSWYSDYNTTNNSCSGASGTAIPCLGFLLRPFWSTSPGLSHKAAILYHWCRGHTISCNTIPCFVVPSILHILGLENTSHLWRQCFCLQEAHKTGTTEPQLLLYNLPLPWSSAASSDIRRTVYTSLLVLHTHCERSPIGVPPSNRISLRVGSGIESSWARSLKRDM